MQMRSSDPKIVLKEHLAKVYGREKNKKNDSN